jgi:hypothetical protein
MHKGCKHGKICIPMLGGHHSSIFWYQLAMAFSLLWLDPGR